MMTTSPISGERPTDNVVLLTAFQKVVIMNGNAAILDMVETALDARHYGLGWDLENVALAGKQARAVGHDGDLLGGKVASLMMFPEHGIVVSVISNISTRRT